MFLYKLYKETNCKSSKAHLKCGPQLNRWFPPSGVGQPELQGSIWSLIVVLLSTVPLSLRYKDSLWPPGAGPTKVSNSSTPETST